ncbi:MAG: AI-2E family transporter [Atopobiaceae bacterium]|nr:AI-2E family transporter [Atopobiaceae bacterium]
MSAKARFSFIDRRYAKICAYASATVLATAAAIMCLQAASPVFAKAWNLIRAVLEPMVYGAAFSYVLNPLVKRITRYLSRFERFAGPENGEKRRNTAVVLALIQVALIILMVLLLLLVMVAHSLSSLDWVGIQAYIADLMGNFDKLVEQAEQFLEEWHIVSTGSENNLVTAFNGAKNAATTLLFAVIFGIYFLIDGPRVTDYLARITKAILGEYSVDPSRIIEDADFVFSGYFRGQGIDALIVGGLSGIALTAIGVPFGPVVGLLTGLGNLIPYVGGPVGFASVALMCAPEGSWGKMILGFVVMAVVMFVDANIINPKLLSNNVEVHPILVVAALIAGGAVGGVAGMLVAVPTAAFLKIQLDRWLEKREDELAVRAVDGEEEDEDTVMVEIETVPEAE